MKRRLFATALALGVLASGSIAAAPAATAATGVCSYVATLYPAARKGTVSNVVCSGTRKVRVELRFYASSSSGTDLYAYGSWAATGQTSSVTVASPAVVTQAKGVTN